MRTWLRRMTPMLLQNTRLSTSFEHAVPSALPTKMVELLPENNDENDFVFPQGHGRETTSVASQDILAVMREPDHRPDQEYSRLHKPLAEERFRKGLPVRRDSTRELVLKNHEYCVTALHDLLSAESEAVEAAKQQGAPTAVPQQPTLPYDEPQFADVLLQMEVDGQIDACWQDAKKAHFEDVEALVGILRDMKVKEIAVIDTSQKTSVFDYIVVGTCEGSRHMHLASWAVQEADTLQRVAKLPRQRSDDLWEAVPVGRILINLMVQSYRDRVNVERKWAVARSMDPLNAARSAVSEGRPVLQHGLWLLTLNLRELQDFEVDYCKDMLLDQR